MTMVVNNYLNEGRSHTEVIELMSLGFTGKLLQWWNNCLTEESKEDIKHAVQKDEEGTPIFDERIGKGVPDGVNTLIYTVMKHFVGKPSNITSRIYDQLSNLRCKNLGEYRWYENVFTTRVMHRSDCNSLFWKEKFINGLPRLFDEKVKEALSTSLGVIDYDDLTYGDISSTIQSEGIKLCRDLKIQSSKSKAKYEVGNFCTQYGLPSVIPKRKSKFREKSSSERPHRKRKVAKYYRKQKFRTDDFYKKGKSKSTGKPISKASGKCFNRGKRGHFRTECKQKAKALINTLIYQSSSEPSRASSSSSSGPDVGMACKDSCCRNKTINVLSKHEELILDLIEQIEDPIIKAQRLSEFHKTLVKEPSKPELRIQESKVDLEKIYNRFTKSKKEVTAKDLQKEIKETKSKVRSLEQEVTILRVDHNLLDQRLKYLENNSHQGNEEGTSFQNSFDEEVDETVNPTAEMVQKESNEKFLETINRINFQKWHSKVRIVISKDFEFEVIALIDSGADLNCIQEGIIPSKYFKKTRERLTSASGGKMQIEFKIPKAHVCQDNTCFKTTFVLVKNMTDRVILGNPFMCLLYPFTTDNEGITIHPFSQPVKFKFLRNPEPREISNLQNVSVSKTLNPLTAKIHKKCKQA
ncbi:hypothetical protein RGQ29_016599 [Quercus rubra]|uniref:Peptidase A2 domain-containing protein n=1 Tax=Quercus rubra TaxID=3512 RepID=A0AAN7FJT5_QUERU|nr:hypothetical protein RGQ29_016599 [Quercus rubra]